MKNEVLELITPKIFACHLELLLEELIHILSNKDMAIKRKCVIHSFTNVNYALLGSFAWIETVSAGKLLLKQGCLNPNYVCFGDQFNKICF